ncbi:DUF3526 domain-containing protein [Aliiglaciecola sp. NS0011-25]|uniref:DUF3526 domain-containing protein n=1 Tax=Aliiglaciecola sp. NS0011-25 TaxID=3127654 RepID=UPI00310A021A
MKTLLNQEWLLFRKSPGNILLIAILLGMSIIAAINGIIHVSQQRAVVQQAVTADIKKYEQLKTNLNAYLNGELEAQEFYNPSAAYQNIAPRTLVPEPPELSVLSAAEVRPTPLLLKIGMQTRHKDPQPSLEDPVNRLDGPFDLVFIATWIVPLFVIFWGFDVMARDREQSSASLLANQRSLRSIIIARLLIRFIVILSIVGGVATCAVLLTEYRSLTTALPALIVWITGLSMTILFWSVIAAMVSAKAQNTAQASLQLLCCWIVIAILMPALSGVVVKQLAPPPNHLERVIKHRDISNDLNQRRYEITEEYYRKRPQNKPIRQGNEYEQYFVKEFYPRSLAFDLAFSPLALKYEKQRIKHVEVMRLLSVFSPPLGLKMLTEDLAGSAPQRRLSFLQSVDSFQTDLRNHFDFKLASMRPLSVKDIDSMPQYSIAPETVSSRWGRVIKSLGLILLPLILLMLVAKRMLGRVTPY